MNQHVHLIGIGGTGMGPLAKVFLEMGLSVSGSDLQPSETTNYLENLGAKVYFSHDANNINGATSVVYSSAISSDNPEMVAAHEKGVAVFHRSEMLAKLLNDRRGIAIGGAHGKTTITSMTSLILEEAGFDPTVLIGARFTPFGPGAKFGQGDFVVAEADESDRSFLRYRPEVAVVTSIEADHLENYNGAFQELVNGYRQFLHNCSPTGLKILGIDDPVVREMSQEFPSITYGLSAEADWRAEVVCLIEGTAAFTVYRHGEFYGEFQLGVPGKHNVANALAALVVADYAGVPIARSQEALKHFSGAQRRFQVIGEREGVLVVDDYAHHPTEIAATIQAARDGWKDRRIIAVFQPHRYTRTHFLMNEFAESFKGADVAVLTDIYSPPPDKPISGVSSQVLASKIQSHGVNVLLIPRREDLATYLVDCVKPNDLVLTMGAGSIWQTAYELFESLV